MDGFHDCWWVRSCGGLLIAPTDREGVADAFGGLFVFGLLVDLPDRVGNLLVAACSVTYRSSACIMPSGLGWGRVGSVFVENKWFTNFFSKNNPGESLF
jgi:hypothetical protein